jgi:DNA-binding response OmpR family regulator
MTVTPIHRRRGQTAAMISDDPSWTLTLDLRVSGATDPAVLGLIADLRRLVDRSSPELVGGGVLRIDVPGRTVQLGGRPIALSRLEFNLLLFLAEHPGGAFTRGNGCWRRSGASRLPAPVRSTCTSAGSGPRPMTCR